MYKNIKILTHCFSILHKISWISLPNFRKSKKLIDQTRFIRYSRLVTLAIANFVYGKNFQQLQVGISRIRFSGNQKQVIDYQKILQEWEYAQYLGNKGHYKTSCQLHINCLERIYASKGVDQLNHLPRYLSNNWIGAFGHIGLLGTYVTAQELGIISGERRILSVYTQEQRKVANFFFQDKLLLQESSWKSSLLEHPSQWHISERLMMIKSLGSFIPLYELLEQVYTASILQNRSSSMQISSDYEMNARENLSKLGLPRDAWFVGFHLRETLDPLDLRQARMNSYLPSLREITKNGGWVIRFGTGNMEDIVGLKNIINLNTDNLDSRHLHPYILAKSKFLLSTNSGPCTLAWSYGTPVLQTNTIAIARNILTASNGSLWLPKIWIKDGEKCSYARIVGSAEGYSETNLKEKERAGFSLRENTEDEILEATKDMLGFTANLIQGGNYKKLNEIRSHFNVVGHGTIAPSFLERHQNWYLN